MSDEVSNDWGLAGGVLQELFTWGPPSVALPYSAAREIQDIIQVIRDPDECVLITA